MAWQLCPDLPGCSHCAEGAGPCCAANPTPGCQNVDCCNTVCDLNPECCADDGEWTLECVALAVANCDGFCGECGGSPGNIAGGSAGSGDCCIAHGGIGCNAPGCEACVCAQDSFCCDISWDGICADRALTVCAGECRCAPAPPSNCCIANNTAFCDDAECCESVCKEDPYCCEVVWDECCANLATEHCPELGGCHPTGPPDPPLFQPAPPAPSACGPGAGDCLSPAGTASPGCNDLDCCVSVCHCDPFCCDIEWDAFCYDPGPDASCLCGTGQCGAINHCSPGPPLAFSCKGNCGGAATGGCWCDEACCHFGDCCIDKAYECLGCTPDDPDAVPISQYSTCLGACSDEPNTGGGGCSCDEGCCERGDCCPDKHDHCDGCIPPIINPADLTGDNTVGVDDLLILLANWGDCEYERCFVMEAPDACPGDLNHDHTVGVDDLLFLLENWSD